MGQPKIHKITANNIGYNYSVFDSAGEFNEFVDREMDRLSNWNSKVWKKTMISINELITDGSEWFGTPLVQNIQELEVHNSFLGMHLIKTIQPKIKEYLAKYLNYLGTHVLPKPKIEFNDLGLGIFSFDRAATGLHRQQVIDIRTPIDRVRSQISVELGRCDFRTSTKNVFAFFKDKQNCYPSMRLYLMAGANANVQGNELLYVGLACSELIDFMMQRNVPVEVMILLGTTFESHVCMGVVRVKRFQDVMDKNKLLLMSSDPRYFRFRGFKALIALCNYFNLDIPASLGRLSQGIGRSFVDAIGTDGFVFEQSYSLEAAAKEVTRIIETYAQRIKNGKKAA